MKTFWMTFLLVTIPLIQGCDRYDMKWQKGLNELQQQEQQEQQEELRAKDEARREVKINPVKN